MPKLNNMSDNKMSRDNMMKKIFENKMSGHKMRKKSKHRRTKTKGNDKMSGNKM